jgi:hypothetical protein
MPLVAGIFLAWIGILMSGLRGKRTQVWMAPTIIFGFCLTQILIVSLGYGLIKIVAPAI